MDSYFANSIATMKSNALSFRCWGLSPQFPTLSDIPEAAQCLVEMSACQWMNQDLEQAIDL
ncbi:MAG: hypothetical protein AAGE59_06550 [Cyanobacteria bacterium P01_F01_bin.86]